MGVQNSALRRVGRLGLVLLAGATVSFAHESKERVALDWKRDAKAAPHRQEAAPPAPPEMPVEIAAPAGANVQASRIAGPGAGSGVDGAAARAADEMAGEAVRVWGQREAWRAGFARGLSAALDDPRLGAWDREAGLRMGRLDPRAKPLGDHLANEAAEGPADSDAETRVKERFMDLSKEPRASKTDKEMSSLHRYGPSIPPFAGPYAAEPVLDDVFRGYPPSRAAGLSGEGRSEVVAWRVDRSYAYDAHWRDADAAFDRWRERQRRGSAWSRYAPAERERFRAVFADRFDAAIRSMDRRVLDAAWRLGFSDGWRYGAGIQSEWAYRRGYAEGFDAAVAETASIAFPYAYEKLYMQSYDHWFTQWSSTAHPGIGTVRMTDESGDGVYEPGENALMSVEVLNYGGGFGVFDLIASGESIAQPATKSIRLVGRGRMPESQKLTVRIADRTAPKTRSDVILSMGDAREDTPIYVSRPLELMDAPGIDVDRLGGRVTLTLAVQNTSRKDVSALIRVDSVTGKADSQRYDLGTIPAAGSKRATVTFTGIHPLDLIGSESKWRASLARGDQVDDTRELRIPQVATDLSNPDLMDFMIALARTPSVSRADVKDSRALMMQRLRADWERAIDSDGNPYKRDYEAESMETVLGQLARLRASGRTYASPQVFDGMDRDVDTLADDLPGAHPSLRKWMRKLATRLK